MEVDNHGDTPNRPTPPYYIYSADLSAHTGARKSPKESWGYDFHKQLFFLPATAGIFLRPQAAF